MATEPLTVSGKVTDAEGNPIEHAAVVVYSAGVRKGFNLFCPTCYVDCGKRTFTSRDGTYSIGGLSTELIFNILAIHDGYDPAWVEKVDPQKGPADNAVLKKRTPPENLSQIVSGKVVDSHGTPIPDALIEEAGAISGPRRSFGPGGWVDLMAVTDKNGDFEIAYGKPLDAAIVEVTPRGFAPKLATINSGKDRTTITVSEGVTVTGRLVESGKPVGQAEVGLLTHNRFSGEGFHEVRIGTNDKGKFSITNVPPDRIWYLYGKMESLATRDLSSDVVEFATKGDGQVIDLGDVAVRSAYTLHGRVILSDGRQIPDDMRITLTSDRIWTESQTHTLASNGSFEFKGLSHGVYVLLPSVKGYQEPDVQSDSKEILIEGNATAFEMLLTPSPSPSKK